MEARNGFNNLGIMVNRGQVWFANLENGVGSTQGGERPVLIIQNDIGNKFSPVCTIIPLTSQSKKQMPTHVTLFPSDGVNKKSICMAEQIQTISKSQIIATGYVGTISEQKMVMIENAIKIQLGMKEVNKQNMEEILNEIKNMKEDLIGYEEDMIKYNKSRHFNALILAIKELKTYCMEKGLNPDNHIDERYNKFLKMDVQRRSKRLG